MIDPLTEAEDLCKKTLEVLGTQRNLPPENVASLRNKLQDLLSRIAESKKKIMVRSPEGRGITTEVLNNASKVYETTANFSQHGGSGKTLGEVSDQLSRLENSIEKLEIYWKSFEYVTT